MFRMKLFRCIIMGPVGSGKGTISQRIMEHFRMWHLPCGDYLRVELKEKTELGIEARRYMDRGELVPDSLVAKIILSKLEYHKNENLLLDGFPRTIKQAQVLEEKSHIDAVLELDVPAETIVDRLKDRWIHVSSGRIYNTGFNPPKIPEIDDVTGEPLIQRDDDKPETVRKRLANYKHWEEPLAAYYTKLGLLKKFSGTKTNEIWPKVYEYLYGFMEERPHLKKH